MTEIDELFAIVAAFQESSGDNDPDEIMQLVLEAQRQVRMDTLNAVYGEHDSVEEDENMTAMEGLVSEVVEETVW